MAAPFSNLYTHRKVADASTKSCDICYKLSTSVLITPDKKDFFYICPIHLKDVYFCTSKINEDAVRAKKEKELADETAKLKKEYEEKQRKKKDKQSKEKDGDSKEEAKDTGKENADEKDVIKDGSKIKDGVKDETIAVSQEEPRVFELKSAFYKQRLQRKRQNEAAKRDRERVSQPNYFPSVPTDLPHK